MIARTILPYLKDRLTKFPVVSLTGPRQSGKTTLLRNAFPDYTYLSLEDPDLREYAEEDPKDFFKRNHNKVIIDEAQKVPRLFSYMQGVVDDFGQAGQFILSGSQNFILHKNINQSLAGRVAICKLLPFDFSELKTESLLSDDWQESLVKGFYPRPFDFGIPPQEFYPAYIESYVERDVKEIVNVRNLILFRNFVRLCAGRIGQVLNLSSLASDAGISHSTAQEWISLLESSYILFRLPPYFRNFSKRLIKSPKLYFYDVGLAASLLTIKDPAALSTHYLRGNLFENLIMAEMMKRDFHQAKSTNLYFWRDSNGRELDCLIPEAGRLHVYEIKSSTTFNKDFLKGFRYFRNVAKEAIESETIIYGGLDSMNRNEVVVEGWKNW